MLQEYFPLQVLFFTLISKSKNSSYITPFKDAGPSPQDSKKAKKNHLVAYCPVLDSSFENSWEQILFCGTRQAIQS